MSDSSDNTDDEFGRLTRNLDAHDLNRLAVWINSLKGARGSVGIFCKNCAIHFKDRRNLIRHMKRFHPPFDLQKFRDEYPPCDKPLSKPQTGEMVVKRRKERR